MWSIRQRILSRYFSTSQPASKGLDLTGIYPPVTTPFNKDESLAWDRLGENIAKYDQVPLRGYLVQGSNGEYCYMSKEERVEMVKQVCLPMNTSLKTEQQSANHSRFGTSRPRIGSCSRAPAANPPRTPSR